MSKPEVSSLVGRAAVLTCLLALFAWGDLWAQTSTGTIRGRVIDDRGAPVVAASVLAVSPQTGAQRGTLSAQNGFYNLVGLQPGTYELRVSSIGFSGQSQTVRVLVGQSLTIDLQLTPQAVQLEGITVVGTRAVETRTSEMATNITQEQIENLPQQDRNFLNFAGLAPGVTVSRAETNKQISAGGLPANKINVFIDGTSFKNDVLEGGVHGQDASRGNPFPQLAIQEFRVITQNFKAEYQRAASAVVTAVTRSGTNQFELNGFLLGQNQGLVEPNPGICRVRQENNEQCDVEPEYERLQAGISMGGPIIRDRLHYFAGYEGNYQNREAQVALGPQGGPVRNRFAQYEGTIAQPFRSHLPFGKLTYQAAENQTIELSYNGRFETDERGAGGQNAAERSENVRIGYNVLTLQHGFSSGNWFNQAHVSGQRSTWNPTTLSNQGIGLVYEDIISLGGRSTTQEFVQDRIALRNDLTYSGLRLLGNQVIKGGVNLDFLNYQVSKRFEGVPQFFFRPGNLEVPYRAVFGSGDPGMDEDNVQFGAYVQTDWDVNDRLQLNLGLRWDAETNLFNNRWVTPDSIRQQLGAWQVPDSIRRMVGNDFPQNYFTRGTEDRPIYLGAFQPRLGFSLDMFGTGRTVLHGGYGIYFDREIWNRLLDERFRLQWLIRNFNFTTDPTEVGGNTLLWRPEYLSREGIESVVNQGQYGRAGEVFLLNNDTRPSRTQQWNLGVRQSVSNFSLGAAYRGVRGHNIFSWYCATPNPVHGFCGGEGRHQDVPNNYGLILSTDEGRTWYDALDLTVEKPFTQAAGWGFTLAYTMANASRKGMDFFTLNFPMVAPENWPRVDQPIERHRVNLSGIVGLPLDFQLSTFAQFGSGARYDRRDERLGWGPRRVQVSWASEEAPAFRQVDLRLQKNFQATGRGRISLIAEVVNVFNNENFNEYEGLYRFDNGQLNPRFGQPLWWTAETGRRLQLGLDFGLR